MGVSCFPNMALGFINMPYSDREHLPLCTDPSSRCLYFLLPPAPRGGCRASWPTGPPRGLCALRGVSLNTRWGSSWGGEHGVYQNRAGLFPQELLPLRPDHSLLWGRPVHCGMFTASLHLLDAVPLSPSPTYGTPKCLQTLLRVHGGGQNHPRWKMC